MDNLDELGCMRSTWSGELEDRPVDPWDSENLLLIDSESGMFADGLELEEGMLCEVMELGGGDNVVDCYRRAMSRDGTDCTPASITSESEEIGTVGFDVECLMPDPWP
jgi:hypothetical protein